MTPTPLPDFRPWPVIQRERARRAYAITFAWSAIVLSIMAFGYAVLLMGDAIAVSAEASYQARTLGADAIPTLGYAQ